MKVVDNFNVTITYLLYFKLILIIFYNKYEPQCVDVKELYVVWCYPLPVQIGTYGNKKWMNLAVKIKVLCYNKYILLFN